MVDSKNKGSNKNEILNELLSKQRKNITTDKKLQYSDLKRICKFLSSSIFDSNNCSLWTGYVTNANNINKGVYINFYFRNKKIALHRLLYINFIDDLSDNEYLKFSCINKGKCCCIAHLCKFEYVQNEIADNNTDAKFIKHDNNKKSFKLSFE